MIIPLGWVFINANGENENIPRMPGSPVYRIVAKGTVLAVGSERSAETELAMFRRYTLPGTVDEQILERYKRIVMDRFARQGVVAEVESAYVASYALSDKPCENLVVTRTAAHERRVEIPYLLHDRCRQFWRFAA
ncbi:MAG: hypothetical protein ACYC4U_17060 [Pirellulaceae bacterium]